MIPDDSRCNESFARSEFMFDIGQTLVSILFRLISCGQITIERGCDANAANHKPQDSAIEKHHHNIRLGGTINENLVTAIKYIARQNFNQAR